MVEETIINYLNINLPEGIEALAEHPVGPDPKRFVIVERTGSSERDLVESTMLVVQSYGPTLYEAARLNSEVKRIMRMAVALPEISSCKLNSDYNYTDTTKKEYRYQAVFDVVTHI